MYKYSTKEVVENCKSITTQFLNKYHYFDNIYKSGSIIWSRNSEIYSRIGISVNTDNTYLHLSYTFVEDKVAKDYDIPLLKTKCYFGGYRYWFGCIGCNRRVGVVYMGDRSDFLCRKCLDLSYESCNESKLYRFYNHLFKPEKIEEDINKLKKKYYKGKPTRKYKILQERLSKPYTEGNTGIENLSHFLSKI